MKNADQLIPKPPVKPLEIKQALVGIGLDETDTTVFNYVDFLTRHIPISAAYFVHVLPPIDWMSAMLEKESVSFADEFKATEQVIEQLEKQVQQHISQREGMYIEYDVRAGNPLREILQSVDELDVDLLMIGQSNTKTSHNILAKNLIRKIKANALVIPQDATPSISHILVPVDFSKNSGRTLEAAVQLQKQLKHPVRITCLFVYRVPSLEHFKVDAPWIQTVSTVEANIRSSFEDFIFEYIPEYQDKVDIVLEERNEKGIAYTIQAYAEALDCDLLFLGAKGHSKVHLLLLGSVTEELLDSNDQIPMMVIR